MGIDYTAELIYGLELRYKDVMKIFKKYIYETEKDDYKRGKAQDYYDVGGDIYSLDDDVIYNMYMYEYERSIYDIIESIQLIVIDKFEGFKDLKLIEIPKLYSYKQDSEGSYEDYEDYKYFLVIDEQYYKSYETCELIRYLKLKNTSNFKYMAVLNVN